MTYEHEFVIGHSITLILVCREENMSKNLAVTVVPEEKPRVIWTAAGHEEITTAAAYARVLQTAAELAIAMTSPDFSPTKWLKAHGYKESK